MTVYVPEEFTSDEEDILRRYFTNLDGPVFALVNLPEVVKGALFARYSLIGTLVAAVGAALAGVPEWAAGRLDVSDTTALRYAFVAYALLGVIVLAHY